MQEDGGRNLIADIDVFIRLVVALLLGGLIGYERQACNKSAGLRTHVLVCIGSCLIMVLSINIYHTVQGLTNADPTRLAAQVVSGIGFLGAGTIMKEGATIKGLTTAASLWVVSGVGLAVGSGYYFSALFATVLVFLTLTMLQRFEKAVHIDGVMMVSIDAIDQPGQIGKICGYFGSSGISIQDIRIEEESNQHLLLSIALRLPEEANTNGMTSSLMMIDGIYSVKWNEKFSLQEGIFKI